MWLTFSNPKCSSHWLISLCDILEFSSVEVSLCIATSNVRVCVSSEVMLHLKRKSHPLMMFIRFIEIRIFVTFCSDYNCLGIHFMLILLNPRILWCMCAHSTLMLSFKTNSKMYSSVTWHDAMRPCSWHVHLLQLLAWLGMLQSLDIDDP